MLLIRTIKTETWLFLLALFAGAIMPLAFAPFYLFPIAILSTAILIRIWVRVTPLQAFWRGLFFGIGMFGVGVSWIFVSIHEFGNTAVPLALIFTAVFVLSLAFFPAIQGYIVTWLFGRESWYKILLVFPLSWVLLEWIRSWLLTGFPWLLLGYSQIYSPLKGYIPILGAYGVAFLMLYTAAGFNYCLIKDKSLWKKITVMMTIIIIWFGGSLLTAIPWTKAVGIPIKVTLIQGDVSQDMKWLPENIIPTLKIYYGLTQQHWDSKIIIWPEAAIPLPLSYAKTFIEQLDSEARAHDTSLLIGIPVEVPHSFSFYNAMIALGNGSGHYYKRYLVPFGEYVPLGEFMRGIMGILSIPMSDMQSGPASQSDLIAGGIKIAPFICYEIAYANALFHELPAAKLLVTISNDAWFGDSLAPTQHLQIGQFRAIQSGRDLLFSANNGVTAIINDQGRILQRLPQFQRLTLTGKVQPRIGTTPSIRYGNTPILASFWLLFLLLLLYETKTRKSV